MTERIAWFCPSCQKYHAPHCDSCPEKTVATPLPPNPVYVVPAWQPKEQLPAPWCGDPIYQPNTASCGTTVKADADVIGIN